MKNEEFQSALARLMLVGTLVAAAVIAVGLIWYLSAHGGEAPGVHVFSGEPKYLENPVLMVQHALQRNAVGHRQSFIMIGVVLLLLNPILRVAFAVFGFAVQKDRLYSSISLFVLTVLVFSFFW